ncbi:MAG TPA: PhnD/SsuA/transferrin family substrate-binding protein [Polyangiaceae bacterium]
MEILRFAFSGEDREASVLAPLTDFLSTMIGKEIVPTPLGTYPALLEALRTGWCALGWLPPLVAHDLDVCRQAVPLAAASRRGGRSYSACFVASRESRIWHVGQLAGTRVGWVSKLSAAGYVVPRWHLTSLGRKPESLFASEKMYGTHRAVRRALGSECDVVATYVETGFGERVTSSIEVPHRVIAVSGPIPSDVVSASARLDVALRERLGRALLSFEAPPESRLVERTRVERFTTVTSGHWSPVERWQHWGRQLSAVREACAVA